MKRIIILTTIFSVLLLSACSGSEKSNSATAESDKSIAVERGTIEETAVTFVQAMIDADEEVLIEIYDNPKDPLEYMLQDDGPFFAGTDIDEYLIDVRGETEVRVKRKDEEGPTYFLDIEMIGDNYFVTDF